MHSSRMRTGRSLTVCRGVPPFGGCLVPGCLLPGGLLPGGSPSWQGWFPSWGGLPRGGSIPVCTEAEPPLLTESQTPVKTLPWPNFFAASKNSRYSEFKLT